MNKKPLDLVLRRRAAYMTLSEVLDGDTLLQAMWMIEERDHNADKLTFLGIVGVTAEIFGVDNKIISSIYIKLNKNLALPSDQLSADPWNDMLRQRGINNNEELQYSGTSSSIFRVNDILCDIEIDLVAESIHQIGQAIASEAIQDKYSCIILARDHRDSSLELSQAIAEGISSTGLNVIDLGIQPIPVLNFVNFHVDMSIGLLISDGHHSSEYNGLKIVVVGEILERERIKKIKQRIDNTHFIISEQKGHIEKNITYAHEYINIICDDIDISKSLKVVVEGKQDTVSQLATYLFQSLGCEVINLDNKESGNLSSLVLAIIQHQADVGFSFDNEGGRLRVVDSEGNIIRADQLMMVFSSYILNTYPACQIIHDTHDTSPLATLIREKKGQPILWKNGSIFMTKELKRTRAKLAGDIHGHIYFSDRWFGFDDALYTAVRMLELLSKDPQSSHEIFAALPEGSHIKDLKLELSANENQHIITELISVADFPTSGNITDIDGLRVDFKNSWLLIRVDLLSSALAFHFEADSEKELIMLQNKIKQMLIKIKPGILIPF